MLIQTCFEQDGGFKIMTDFFFPFIVYIKAYLFISTLPPVAFARLCTLWRGLGGTVVD